MKQFLFISCLLLSSCGDLTDALSDTNSSNELPDCKVKVPVYAEIPYDIIPYDYKSRMNSYTIAQLKQCSASCQKAANATTQDQCKQTSETNKYLKSYCDCAAVIISQIYYSYEAYYDIEYTPDIVNYCLYKAYTML